MCFCQERLDELILEVPSSLVFYDSVIETPLMLIGNWISYFFGSGYLVYQCQCLVIIVCSKYLSEKISMSSILTKCCCFTSVMHNLPHFHNKVIRLFLFRSMQKLTIKSLLWEMCKQKSPTLPPFHVLHSPSSCAAITIFMCAHILYSM